MKSFGKGLLALLAVAAILVAAPRRGRPSPS